LSHRATLVLGSASTDVLVPPPFVRTTVPLNELLGVADRIYLEQTEHDVEYAASC
jgi:hypothetical protein